MPSPGPSVEQLTGLTGDQQAQVRALAEAVERADGVAALSEQFLLDLQPGSGAGHLLAGSAAAVHGYAQLADPGLPSSAAELLVAPHSRRQGIGRVLVGALPRDVRLWAHGDLPAARAFAAALGMRTVRELHRMRLRFADTELDQPTLPPGLTVRAFRPGADDEAWVATNAAAFAHHPEQGRLTVADLRRRMAQPWFDPEGFLLVVPSSPAEWPRSAETGAESPHFLATRGGESGTGGGESGTGGGAGGADEVPAPGAAPAIAAFHWTKASPQHEAEVYVLGVHPAYQGRGLARTVTLLGLHHLRGRGHPDVVLYTDADNAAAVHTYRRLGFETEYIDRMVAFPAVPEGATMNP